MGLFLVLGSTILFLQHDIVFDLLFDTLFELYGGCLLYTSLVHTRCEKAVVGISGGLDSTLALLVAVRTFDKLQLDRAGIIGITMPGFGTTDRTYNNALELMRSLGVTVREIPIRDACLQHFRDIGLDPEDRSAAYENSQARERTQILDVYKRQV